LLAEKTGARVAGAGEEEEDAAALHGRRIGFNVTKAATSGRCRPRPGVADALERAARTAARGQQSARAQQSAGVPEEMVRVRARAVSRARAQLSTLRL